MKVLLVDDDLDGVRLIQRALREDYGPVEVDYADTPIEAVESLRAKRYDLILFGYRTSGTGGFSGLSEVMFARGKPRPIPTVVLLETGYTTLGPAAMRLGAVDFMLKADVGPALLHKTIQHALEFNQLAVQLAATRDRVDYLTWTDPLTDVGNRAALMEALDEAVAAADRDGSRFALTRVDLELFRNINEDLGQAAGDMVLQVSAKRLERVLRKSDQVFRVGADEFAILSYNDIDEGSAEAATRRFGDALAEPMQVVGDTVECQGSFGVAIYPTHGRDRDGLMAAAQQAMDAARLHDGGICMAENIDELHHNLEEHAHGGRI